MRREKNAGMTSLPEAPSEEFGDCAEHPAAVAPGELEGAVAPLANLEDELVALSPGGPSSESDSIGEPLEATGDLELSTLVDGLVDASVGEIDELIAALQTLRDQLDDGGRRVRRELGVFAHVGDSAMQTTRVIGKALGQWKSIMERRGS
jgi:hypothetical protein